MHLPAVKRNGRSTRARSGNAIVELAVTLPMLTTLVFGTVEVCHQIHTKQAVVAAAYECARVAIHPSATDSDVAARMSAILAQRGVKGATVTTTPTSITGIPRGTQITVVVSAPAVGNSPVGGSHWLKDVQAECVMLKQQ